MELPPPPPPPPPPQHPRPPPLHTVVAVGQLAARWQMSSLSTSRSPLSVSSTITTITIDIKQVRGQSSAVRNCATPLQLTLLSESWLLKVASARLTLGPHKTPETCCWKWEEKFTVYNVSPSPKGQFLSNSIEDSSVDARDHCRKNKINK